MVSFRKRRFFEFPRAALLTGLLSLSCTYDPKRPTPGDLECKDDNGCPSGYYCVGARSGSLGFCCNNPDAAACTRPDASTAFDSAKDSLIEALSDGEAGRVTDGPDTQPQDTATAIGNDLGASGLDVPSPAPDGGTESTDGPLVNVPVDDASTDKPTPGADAIDSPGSSGGSGGSGPGSTGGTGGLSGPPASAGTTGSGGTSGPPVSGGQGGSSSTAGETTTASGGGTTTGGVSGSGGLSNVGSSGGFAGGGTGGGTGDTGGQSSSGGQSSAPPPEINVKQGSANLPSVTGSYDFGSVNYDGDGATTSGYITFTIENLGTGNLNLGALSLTGNDFDKLDPSSTVVSPSGSMTFSVRFDPLSSGPKSATLTIPSDDSDESSYTITLTGKGLGGALDSSFGGGDGIVIHDISGDYDYIYAHNLHLQSNGKIVAGGYYYTPSCTMGLSRYNADGSPDLDFNGKGWLTQLAGGDNRINGSFSAIQPDGKILAGGSFYLGDPGAHYDFGIARYQSNGVLDTTFGTDGLSSIRITDGLANIYDVAIRDDGKIVAAGQVSPAAGGTYFALVRYTPTGALDSSFGTDGKVITTIKGEIMAMVMQPEDEKILVAGTLIRSATDYAFGVARFNANGTIDTTFGSSGLTTIKLSEKSFDEGQDLVLQPDQKILVVGVCDSDTGGAYDLCMARLNPDGTLDSGFGTAGRVVMNVGGMKGTAAGLQGDGKIVVGGGNNDHFTLVRYDAQGLLDPYFGQGGVVTTTLTSNVAGRSLVIQPDGKILLGGYGGDPTLDVIIARYWP